MFSFNNKISIRQLQMLLLLDIFGTGVIILPRRVAEFAEQDGWMIIIIATLVALVYAFIITSLGRMFPNDSFVKYACKIMTRPLGILISLGFVMKNLAVLAMELRFFGEIVKMTMLEKTPFIVVCMAMLLVGGYAAAKGYEARARIAEILVVIMFIPLIFVFAIGSTDVDFTNILPVMTTDPFMLLTGGFLMAQAFMGLEFCLMVHPYIQKPQKVRGAILQIIIVLGILMLAITFITIAKFGPYDIKRQIWPVLEMMDVIDLPGSFIERQEAFIMSFWIISVFAIVNAGLFFSSLLLKDIVGTGQHSFYIVICIPIILAIAFIPDSISEVSEILDFIFITFGIAYMLVIPLVMLIIARLRGLGERL